MLTLTIKYWLQAKVGDFQVETHQSGANNHGFLIKTSNNQYFLKCYPEDDSSIIRIKREVQFIDYCVQHGIDNVANVIASSIENYCVLFDFVGNNILKSKSAVDKSYVIQSFNFIKKINLAKNNNLPLASESAHSVADFQMIVESRLTVLSKVALNKNLSADFEKTFKKKVIIFLQKVESYYQQIKPECYEELPFNSIISPSDFGLHNALNNADGYYFIDFEYAGNDSLWKFICDFFAQPAYPVDLKYIREVAHFTSWEVVKINSQSLCYVYQLTLLKWCLIILNTAIRQHNKEAGTITTTQLISGLERAESYFENIENKYKQLKKKLTD